MNTAATATTVTRPNLIFILADQLRPDFLSCYGARCIQTPHIDSLAASGVRYDRAYSEHPVCVPARTSLLVGMHAVKTGVLDNGLFLRPDYRACGTPTWPELLSEAGYSTAAIGKMHFYPWDARLGFQYRRIAEDKRWPYIRDDYYHYLRAHGERKYHGNEHEGYLQNKGAIVNRLPFELQPDHYVGLEAVNFVRTYGSEGPFAMMVGFPGPHCPYDPAPEYLEQVDWSTLPEPVPNAGNTPRVRAQNVQGNRSAWNGVDYAEFTRDQKLKIRAHYAALVKQIDHEVGQLLATLRQQGLLENTVVILSADHGDYLGDHDLIGKGHFYESSFHVPLIVSRPASGDGKRDLTGGGSGGGSVGARDAVRGEPVEPRPSDGAGRTGNGGQVSDALVTLTDVTASLLTLAGVDVPAHMDSRPLPDLAAGARNGAAGTGGPGAVRECIVGALGGGWMIQEGPWRLSKYATGETLLFNLEADPQEQRTLASDPGHAAVYRELDMKLTTWMMGAIVQSHRAQRVYGSDLWRDEGFGREGWQRAYPHSFAVA
jgi:arylsulfatase